MDNREFLIPKEGLKVRQEDGSPFPAEGREVTLTNYYRRRIRAGDLVKGKAPAPAKKSTAGSKSHSEQEG